MIAFMIMLYSDDSELREVRYRLSLNNDMNRLNKMIIWLIDLLKCLILGHQLDALGNYYYCERCGHLEVKAELNL